MARKPTKKPDTDDIPTPPMGIETAAASDAVAAQPPAEIASVAKEFSAGGPERACVTCGNITADNACLVCGTRIGGDA